MSETETFPTEALLDLFVYAPLGLALEARELFPKLVQRGKQQATTARVLGQFAMQQGGTIAGDRLAQAHEQVTGVLGALGLWPQPTPDVTTSLVTEPPAAEAPTTPTPRRRTGRIADAPAASSLAIPDYDSLSASQVVPRLEGLSGHDLEAVRRYESAKRARKTILGKIGQLQKAS